MFGSDGIGSGFGDGDGSRDGSGDGFDWSGLLDELRCRPSEWLEARRTWLVRAQRRLRTEGLAVLAVLDERGLVDDSQAGKDGTSTKTARRTRRTARRLKR